MLRYFCASLTAILFCINAQNGQTPTLLQWISFTQHYTNLLIKDFSESRRFKLTLRRDNSSNSNVQCKLLYISFKVWIILRNVIPSRYLISLAQVCVLRSAFSWVMSDLHRISSTRKIFHRSRFYVDVDVTLTFISKIKWRLSTKYSDKVETEK